MTLGPSAREILTREGDPELTKTLLQVGSD